MTTDTIDALWNTVEKFYGSTPQCVAEQQAVLGRLVDAYQDAGEVKKGLWLAERIAAGDRVAPLLANDRESLSGFWYWLPRTLILDPMACKHIWLCGSARAAFEDAYCRHLTS